LAGGLNTYTYVGGNPVNSADPSGLICGTGACVAAAAFALTIADIVIPPSLPPEHAQDAIVPSAGPLELLGGLAGGVRLAGKACGLAIKDVGNQLDEVFHFTSARNAESISRRGLTAGPDGVFTTTNGNLSPLQAQIDLALKPNRGLPDATFRVDLNKVRELGIGVSNPRQVSRAFNQPGGGSEIIINGNIPPSALTRVK